jgi:hypothetical protein
MNEKIFWVGFSVMVILAIYSTILAYNVDKEVLNCNNWWVEQIRDTCPTFEYIGKQFTYAGNETIDIKEWFNNS